MSHPKLYLFQLPLPSMNELLFITVILLLAIFGLVIWQTVEAVRVRRTTRKLLRIDVEHRAQHCGLSSEETKALQDMALMNGMMPRAGTFDEAAARLQARGTDSDVLASLKRKLRFERLTPHRRIESMHECDPGQDVSLTDAKNAWRAGVISVDSSGILLKVPVSATKLKQGDEVKVSFWRELDARYFFVTRVKAVIMSPFPEVMLEHPADLNRYTDREFFRAAANWGLTAKVIRKEAAGEASAAAGGEAAPYIESRTLDVSPGGFRMERVEGIGLGDHLVVTFHFGKSVESPVLRARVIGIDERGIHSEFLNLTVREQDIIHHEILRERRKNR